MLAASLWPKMPKTPHSSLNLSGIYHSGGNRPADSLAIAGLFPPDPLGLTSLAGPQFPAPFPSPHSGALSPRGFFGDRGALSPGPPWAHFTRGAPIPRSVPFASLRGTVAPRILRRSRGSFPRTPLGSLHSRGPNSPLRSLRLTPGHCRPADSSAIAGLFPPDPLGLTSLAGPQFPAPFPSPHSGALSPRGFLGDRGALSPGPPWAHFTRGAPIPRSVPFASLRGTVAPRIPRRSRGSFPRTPLGSLHSRGPNSPLRSLRLTPGHCRPADSSAIAGLFPPDPLGLTSLAGRPSPRPVPHPSSAPLS